ncbi:hypothetical protein [Hydrogenovibrio kuenenii]|uniref:hypothetical protein n=1 Tax=Hydrogenovibrio kuenenii TaxID=63658 RepID=UPI000467B0FA|nr:hypothetical protein [Hydrogenovibrio kuenenii]
MTSVTATSSTVYPTALPQQKAANGQVAFNSTKLELPPLELPTRAELEKETKSFSEDVRQLLEKAGIHVPPEVALTNDRQGYVRVANDHPDKQRIEQMFKDHPELQQRYAKISAVSSLHRAAEHYTEYSNQYEMLKGNPAAQSALVESEIARNKSPFHLIVTGNGYETYFPMTVKA